MATLRTCAPRSQLTPIVLVPPENVENLKTVLRRVRLEIHCSNGVRRGLRIRSTVTAQGQVGNRSRIAGRGRGPFPRRRSNCSFPVRVVPPESCAAGGRVGGTGGGRLGRGLLRRLEHASASTFFNRVRMG